MSPLPSVMGYVILFLDWKGFQKTQSQFSQMAPVTQRPVLRVSLVVVGTFFPRVGGNVGGSQDQPLTRTLLNLEAPVKALVERGRTTFWRFK